MNTLLVSKPVLVSPFLGYKLSRSSGNSKRVLPNRLYLPPRSFKANCTNDTSYGDNVSFFPRSNVWDPYKRLGISKDASEEEVWNSRKFLLDQYGGNKKSVESIEAAFEKILMTSFLKRKKTKMNLKSRLKKKVEESPPWVRKLISFIELPPSIIIIRRLFLFAFIACWSVYCSDDGGPAFQVAIALMASMYFLYDKTKNLSRASIFAVGSLVIGWICGSFLAPMIPLAFLQPTWTLELLTALIAYVFLFASCTFLK